MHAVLRSHESHNWQVALVPPFSVFDDWDFVKKIKVNYCFLPYSHSVGKKQVPIRPKWLILRIMQHQDDIICACFNKMKTSLCNQSSICLLLCYKDVLAPKHDNSNDSDDFYSCLLIFFQGFISSLRTVIQLYLPMNTLSFKSVGLTILRA